MSHACGKQYCVCMACMQWCSNIKSVPILVSNIHDIIQLHTRTGMYLSVLWYHSCTGMHQVRTGTYLYLLKTLFIYVRSQFQMWRKYKRWDDWEVWDWCLSSTRNEQSWSSWASEKNERFPLSCCPQAARQCHRVKQHSGYIGRESLCITRCCLYPASSVSGRGLAG